MVLKYLSQVFSYTDPNPLLQFILPVVDGEGVVVPSETMD